MGSNPSKITGVVAVCTGSECRKAGSRKLTKQARACVRELGIDHSTQILRTRCTSMCKRGAVVCIQPANVWLSKASPADVERAIHRYLAKPKRRLRIID